MTWFAPDAGLPPANLARIRRATEALVLAILCLGVEAGIAARFTEPVVVVNTVVVALGCVLAWLARLAYGWLQTTPGRLVVVKVIRLAPAGLAVAGCVADWVLAVAGTQVPYGWLMASLLVMLVSIAAAGVAGSAR